MPHVPFRVRPLPGTSPPARSRAPLASPPSSRDYGPSSEVDIFDLPLPDAPTRNNRPDMPFAAPRRREKQPSNAMLPSLSMKRHSVSVDAVADHLFPGSK